MYTPDASGLTLVRAQVEVAARRTRLGIRFIMFPDCQLLKRLFSECVTHSFGYPLKHNPLQILRGLFCLVILNGLCGYPILFRNFRL